MKTIRHNKTMMTLAFLIVLVLGTPGFSADSKPLLSSEKGAYRTYRFTYQDQNTTTIFPDRLGQKNANASTFMSNLSFDGDLRVKDYGRIGKENIYSLSFDEIRTSRFALNGHGVFDDPALFIGKYKKHEVYVCLDDNHEITRFLFPRKTPQVFKTFMVMVAQEIQVSARQGKMDWSTNEVNQHGRGTVNYHVAGKKGNSIQLEKTRKNYRYPGLIESGDTQDIRLDDRITLNPRGFVEEIDKREKTKITSPSNRKTILDVDKTIRLRMTGAGTFKPGTFGPGQVSAMQSVYPGNPVPDDIQRQELLAKQASYTSYEDIESWVKQFKPEAKDSRANNAMFYRSSGFVKLQPRSADRLADFGRKKGRTSQERTLVMNILASAGTKSAQDAMKTMLTDPVVRKDPQYGVLIQNFSFMDETPTRATLSLLEGLMNGKVGYESYAAAHAYGACIHKLYKNREKERALGLNRLIRLRVAGARTEDERAEYIAALGNAGMFENNGYIAGFFRSPHSRVRAEAAMALRKTETAAVRRGMLNLFQDSDRGVQRSAIQTYLQFSPEEKNIREIKHLLDKEKIQEANFYDLASLLKKNQPRYPELIKSCLRIMVRKKLKDPDLEARIRGMM